MGQSVAVTPLQMVTAMSCIANGGKLMKPMIVSEITDQNGRSVANFTPETVRRRRFRRNRSSRSSRL